MKQIVVAMVLFWVCGIALAGPDQPWQESANGFVGGSTLPLIMLAIGFAYPVYAKLTADDYSWFEFFMHGAVLSVLSVMAIQVGLLAALLLPLYWIYKIFSK